MRRVPLLLAFTCSCSALRATPWAEPRARPAPATVAVPPPFVENLPEARCATTPRAIGRVRDPQLDEISGVVESRLDPRVLFVHNDSGDTPRFFAIDRRGELLAELTLKTVPILLDAEDLAIGIGPGGGSFLYLGDTGNNFASMGLGIPRRKAVVYRIPEPPIDRSARQVKLELTEAFPIWLSFPDGPRDVEAFFVDPSTGDLILLGKQQDGVSQILLAPAALVAAGGGELTLLGQLRFGQAPLGGNPMVTSASIKRDGSAILVRTYSSVFLFERLAGESIMSALGRAPRILPSPPEGQGEAVTFVDQDKDYLTISEGRYPALNCASVGANWRESTK
jgi:hypothetical protein